MNSRPKRLAARPSVAVLGLITIGLSAAAAGSEPDGPGAVHRIDRPVKSETGETIRIVNPFGNVRVRAIPGAAAPSMRVTVQSAAEDVVAARLEVGEHEEGPVYAVVASDRGGALLRADVVVALPDRAGIDVRMEHGDFTMHPAAYPVRLRAESGDVKLRTVGPVDVRVWSGRVVYDPPADAAPSGGRVQTSGAPVDVLMKGAGPLNFRVVSGAAVTTDSTAILRTRTRSGRAVLFGSDEVAATLDIRTDHAPVRLVFEGHR